MGRHRRAYEGEGFSVRIDVPMTPTDRSAIVDAAAEDGLSLTAFARQLLLNGLRAHNIGRPARAAKREVYLRIAARLTEAGKELNALAKLANEEQRIRDERAVTVICQHLCELMAEVPAYPNNSSMNTALNQVMKALYPVGNNKNQLQEIAKIYGQQESLAALEEFEVEIKKALSRALPP